MRRYNITHERLATEAPSIAHTAGASLLARCNTRVPTFVARACACRGRWLMSLRSPSSSATSAAISAPSLCPNTSIVQTT